MMDPSGTVGSELRRLVTGGLLLLAWTAPVHAAAGETAGSEDTGSGALSAQMPEDFMSDRNGDGVLTEDEVMPGMFSLLDVDRDGRVELSEIQAFLAQQGRPFS